MFFFLKSMITRRPPGAIPSFKDWKYGFKRIAMDLGKDEVAANQLAEDIIIKIQGSLILGKGLSDPEIFKSQLMEIKSNLRA